MYTYDLRTCFHVNTVWICYTKNSVLFWNGYQAFEQYLLMQLIHLYRSRKEAEHAYLFNVTIPRTKMLLNCLRGWTRSRMEDLIYLWTTHLPEWPYVKCHVH